MYTVERDDEGIVTITDTDGYTVYDANPDEYIIIRTNSPDLPPLVVRQIKELSDTDILIALANHVELFPDAN